ncbi:hypothetical protein MMC32_004459 [Xylographa parallela]|nr:hypothetical protein [Xylographa parallela]
MESLRLLLIALSLSTLAASSPIASSLLPRSDHQANFYSGPSCSGASYMSTVSDFGCGGTCHQFTTALQSVYLQDGGQGNKPTASCFASFDCSGEAVDSIGISGGANSCTNLHMDEYSCYLYDGC